MEHLRDILIVILPSFSVADYPIIVSVSYYTLNIVTGITLRAIVKNHVHTRWQPYLLNAITAFQGLSCSLENTQIRRFYGRVAYWFTLTTISMISTLTVKGSSSNPCSQMLLYMKGVISLREMVLRMLSQLAGGLLSYRYAQQVWSLGLHEGHVIRYQSTDCVTDLTVDTTLGFLIEFSLTLFDVLTGLLVFTCHHLCEKAVKLSVSCYFVTVGLHLTGMYANPLNATNQTFGCKGITIIEHIAVYWIGPLSATIIGYELHYLMEKGWLQPGAKQKRQAVADDESRVKDTRSSFENKPRESSVLPQNGKVRVKRTASKTKRA